MATPGSGRATLHIGVTPGDGSGNIGLIPPREGSPVDTAQILRRAPAAAILLALALALAACATSEPEKSPAFYEDLARSGAEVNAVAAVSLLSDYRRANALPALELDSTLTAIAQDQA